MRLLILRHAKAEKPEPNLADRDRPLSKRGHKDARRIGAYLAHHALLPAAAIVSLARRTQETWEEMMAELPKPPKAIFDERLFLARSDLILRVIRETPRTVSTLLVIGHNPGLHECVLALIATGDVEARERLAEGLPTSGLVVIDGSGDGWRTLGPQRGRLERFITPRSLKDATA
jgi:phosphohistidine phosphatase